MEIWKDVKGYEGYFQVSNEGRVKGLKRVITRCDGIKITVLEKILTPCKNRKGYLFVCLTKDNQTNVKSVHRLVAAAFVDGDTSLEVNHKDCNKTNNHSDNLEWVTPLENVTHAIENGLWNRPIGENNKTSKGFISVIKDGVEVFKVIGNADMMSKGLIPSCVCRCLSGKLRSHRGYTFKREENENSI